MLQAIIGSAENLEKIPLSAAAGYEAQISGMVAEVNLELESLPEIDELIGHNPLELMEMNHANHAQFMATVFKTNSYELLARTVPWVYRVYRARGFSYDYFIIELNAWIQAINRHLPPADAKPLVEVYNWMIKSHESMIELSVNVDSLSFKLPVESGEMQQIFLALLLHADHKGAMKLAEQSVRTPEEMQAFYLNVITPTLYMIGELWERNEISVAQEHLATAIVSRVLAVIYSQVLPLCTAPKGVIVVTAAPNEFHEIGPRMVADLLELEGWDVIFLGANTPHDELVRMIARENPFMVAISTAVMFNLDRATQAIAAVRSNPVTNGVKILVGGLAFNAVPGIWRELGADGYAADAMGAVIQAAVWWEERGDVTA